MKLFGFNKKSKEIKLRITEPDREWVEDNFKWLITHYGYPVRGNEQIVLSEKFFPKTFSTSDLDIRNLIEDLCNLLSLDSAKINVELHSDLRDVYAMPLEVHMPFEVETEMEEEGYTIGVAQSLLKRPDRLIYNIVYECVRIRLAESKLQFDSGGDTGLFLFLAGIYFDFGILLSQNIRDIGRDNDGFWQTKWENVSEMPVEVMAFGLAMYAKLIDQNNPEWKKELPSEIRSEFEHAIAFLNDSPPTIYNRDELKANDLFDQSFNESKNGDFESAIGTLQKIVYLTDDEQMKADVYNNIGYYQLRIGEYEKSIPNFQKALQLDPDFGFAHDNLGYAFLLTGQVEEGKRHLDRALETGNNDAAYSYRNLALYYSAKNEPEKAEHNFRLAFDYKTIPVDLLEFHYANFLIHQGEAKKGMEYLEEAIKKGEQEAIKQMSEITKNESQHDRR